MPGMHSPRREVRPDPRESVVGCQGEPRTKKPITSVVWASSGSAGVSSSILSSVLVVVRFCPASMKAELKAGAQESFDVTSSGHDGALGRAAQPKRTIDGAVARANRARGNRRCRGDLPRWCVSFRPDGRAWSRRLGRARTNRVRRAQPSQYRARGLAQGGEEAYGAPPSARAPTSSRVGRSDCGENPASRRTRQPAHLAGAAALSSHDPNADSPERGRAGSPISVAAQNA